MVQVKQSDMLLKTFGILFLGLIGLYMMWPLWSETPLSASFTVACFCLFLTVILDGLTKANVGIRSGVFLGYISLLFWMGIMAYVYEECYHTHSRSNFFFINLDSHAMFFLMVLISCIPAMVFVDMYKLRANKFLALLLLVVLATTAFFTFRAVSVNPNAIRGSRTMEFLGQGELLFGTPSYSTIYSLMFMIPIFLHKAINTKGFYKKAYIICFILSLYMVAVSQLATALLISALGILIYLFFRVKQSSKLGILFLILVIVLFMINNNGYNLLMSLADSIEGDWSRKLLDIAKYFAGEQDAGMISGRVEFYKDSWESFKLSPIFGKIFENSGKIGGHATAIDVLGLTGLFGFIPFVIAIICNGYRMSSISNTSYSKPIIYAVVLQMMFMVFTKNIITALPILFTYFVLVPLFIKLESSEDILK